MVSVRFVFVFVLLSVGLVVGYSQNIPNPGHGGDDVFVFINGQELELQGAINSGQFGIEYNGGTYTSAVGIGHRGTELFVNVDGADKSLQDSINDGSLCSSGGGSGGYSGSGYLGHVGDDILVDFNGEKSLQKAIDDGDFAYTIWSPLRDDVCSTDTVVQTNCGRTRTVSGTKNCCVPGDYYDWTGTCVNFCASQGGTAIGIGTSHDCVNSYGAFWPGAADHEECWSSGGFWFGSQWFQITTTMCRCSCP